MSAALRAVPWVPLYGLMGVVSISTGRSTLGFGVLFAGMVFALSEITAAIRLRAHPSSLCCLHGTDSRPTAKGDFVSEGTDD